MTPGGSKTFHTVEAGRGIAALLVVLYHAGAGIFPAPAYWQARPAGGLFDWGYAGIYFFYVLSGFIIMHAHRYDIGEPARLRRYLSRRFVRIYPIYWVVLASVVGVGWLGIGAAPGAERLLSSVLLVGPDNRDTALAVAWTLYHEVLFYTVFAAWILSVKAGAAVTAVWGLAVVAGLFVELPLPGYVVAPVNLLFGYGVLAWTASRRGVPVGLAPLAAIGFVLVGADAACWQQLSGPIREQLFGLTAAIGIAAITARERWRPVAVPRLLLALGGASYSIYLVNYLLLSLLAKLAVVSGLVVAVDARVAFVACVTLALAGGLVVHRLVERPLLARAAARLTARA